MSVSKKRKLFIGFFLTDYNDIPKIIRMIMSILSAGRVVDGTVPKF